MVQISSPDPLLRHSTVCANLLFASSVSVPRIRAPRRLIMQDEDDLINERGFVLLGATFLHYCQESCGIVSYCFLAIMS